MVVVVVAGKGAISEMVTTHKNLAQSDSKAGFEFHSSPLGFNSDWLYGQCRLTKALYVFLLSSIAILITLRGLPRVGLVTRSCTVHDPLPLWVTIFIRKFIYGHYQKGRPVRTRYLDQTKCQVRMFLSNFDDANLVLNS